MKVARETMTAVSESESMERLQECSADSGRSVLLRRLGWLMVLAAVVPIWVAVVRAGLQNLFPYGDGAETVLRAQDVFTGPFPLSGMPAAGGSQTGYDVYFPGAWQLYVIAIPTRVFGVVWGPLLAMGALNTAWIGLTGWLLLRRLRSAEALVGLAFLTLLAWSAGSGFLITPVPMDMVLIPTAAFLVAVWAVADGDPMALPVLAVVANFLWLDHLVLVLTVPLVAGCGAVGLLLWYRRQRRAHDGAASAQVRRVRRGLLGAVGVTVVMWIPTIIQQLTVRPGNLQQLVSSAGTARPVTATWLGAGHSVISVIARAPFWFRGSLENPSFDQRQTGIFVTTHLSLYDLIAWSCLIGALVVLGVIAHRRGDRTGVWLPVVAGVAVVVSVVTTRSAPNYLNMGAPMGYLRALWAVAMFVWLAIAINLVRLLRGRFAWQTAVPAMGVVLVFVAANLPTAQDGYGTDPRMNRLVNTMRAAAVPQLADRGTFRLYNTSFDAHFFSAALALEMTVAKIPYCYPDDWLVSDGSRPACPDEVTGTLTVAVVDGSSPVDTGDILFNGSFLTVGERRELDRLNRSIEAWLGSKDRLTLSPSAAAGFDDLLANVTEPAFAGPIRAALTARGEDLDQLLTDPSFVGFVNSWYGSRGADDPPLFDDAPLAAKQWHRWIELRGHDRSVIVWER